VRVTQTNARVRLRVAIVDDHQLVLDGLVSRLAHVPFGIDVVAAESRWNDLLTHAAFPVDVVVLDLHLDDNIPIGAKLRALRSAGIPAVVMSRHSDGATVTAALRAGALGFVPKTESAEELVTAIHSAASSTQHLAGDAANALHDSLAPAAGLGRQEQNALVLYATGRSIREVAEKMGTTEETIKSYIKRARRKYRDIGLDLGTRLLLRRHAAREGWIPPE
jgi:two-component system uhpT operon response regulator UhpA